MDDSQLGSVIELGDEMWRRCQHYASVSAAQFIGVAICIAGFFESRQQVVQFLFPFLKWLDQ